MNKDVNPTKYNGDLAIIAQNAGDFEALEEVSGSLYICSDAQLPALTSVGVSLVIYADAQLPELKSVGGYIDICADAQLPALTSVGGSLHINADIRLPALTSVGRHLNICADAQLPALRVAHGVEGKLVAVNKWGLWYSTSHKFYAGCQGPLTKRQAIELSKTWEDQDVAQYFAAVIEKIDDAELVETE